MTSIVTLILIDNELLGDIAENIVNTSIKYSLTEAEASGLIDLSIKSIRRDKQWKNTNIQQKLQ